MSNFFIKPIITDTRLRPDHNTVNQYLSLWQPTDIIECSEIWIAPVNGPGNQKAGDRWGRVVSINGHATFDSWMAIQHDGQSICTIVEAPTPAPAFEWPPFVELTAGTKTKTYDRRN